MCICRSIMRRIRELRVIFHHASMSHKTTMVVLIIICTLLLALAIAFAFTFLLRETTVLYGLITAAMFVFGGAVMFVTHRYVLGLKTPVRRTVFRSRRPSRSIETEDEEEMSLGEIMGYLDDYDLDLREADSPDEESEPSHALRRGEVVDDSIRLGVVIDRPIHLGVRLPRPHLSLARPSRPHLPVIRPNLPGTRLQRPNPPGVHRPRLNRLEVGQPRPNRPEETHRE